MQVSLTHGFAFLCMPKCASTSIEAALRPHCQLETRGLPLRHTNLRVFNRLVLPYVAHVARGRKIETICLMREPLSWLHSWFRFRGRDELRQPGHPQHKNCTAGMTFAQFIDAYLSAPQPDFARVGSQFTFLQNGEGTAGVDRVFRYENIELFVGYINEKIGKPLSLPRLNVSPPGELDVDGQRLRKLREHLASDFGFYESI